MGPTSTAALLLLTAALITIEAQNSTLTSLARTKRNTNDCPDFPGKKPYKRTSLIVDKSSVAGVDFTCCIALRDEKFGFKSDSFSKAKKIIKEIRDLEVQDRKKLQLEMLDTGTSDVERIYPYPPTKETDKKYGVRLDRQRANEGPFVAEVEAQTTTTKRPPTREGKKEQKQCAPPKLRKFSSIAIQKNGKSLFVASVNVQVVDVYDGKESAIEKLKNSRTYILEKVLKALELSMEQDARAWVWFVQPKSKRNRRQLQQQSCLYKPPRNQNQGRTAGRGRQNQQTARTSSRGSNRRNLNRKPLGRQNRIPAKKNRKQGDNNVATQNRNNLRRRGPGLSASNRGRTIGKKTTNRGNKSRNKYKKASRRAGEN